MCDRLHYVVMYDRLWSVDGYRGLISSMMVVMWVIRMCSVMMMVVMSCSCAWLRTIRIGGEAKRAEAASAVVSMLFVMVMMMVMSVRMLMMVMVMRSMVRFTPLAALVPGGWCVSSVETFVIIVGSAILVPRT